VTNANSFPDCYDIDLIRPDGSGLVSNGSCVATNFLDATTLDQSGTWTIRFDPRQADIGTATLTAYLATDQTFAITPTAGGVAKAFNLQTPGQNGTVTFTGTTGQKISATATGVSNFPDCDDLVLQRPDGSTLASSGQCGTGNGFVDASRLDQTGTWTVRFDPRQADTGSATVTTYLVTDQTFAITPTAGGVAKTFNLTTPGQNGAVTFAGTTGQKISATATGLSDFADCDDLSLIRPDGSVLASSGQCGTSNGFVDASTLDQTGTWTVLFSPRQTDTGSATVTTYLVTDQTFSITPTAGGVTKAFNLTTPGQNGAVTFTGTTGQKISASATGLSGFADCYDLLLVRPDGSVLAGDAECGTTSGFVDASTLDQNGTWTILFSPRQADTGSATVTTYLVTDQTGTITKGGASRSVTITTPGQNSRWTFSGTTGTNVTASVTAPSFTSPNCYDLTILRPDGSTFASAGVCGSPEGLGPAALDQTGTWTIVVSPRGTETGTATLTLT
jgi:hypothetical protein